MKTRRTFLASLAALAFAPFTKLFPRKPEHFFTGVDHACAPDKCVFARCLNPGGPGPLRFEWVSPDYRFIGKDGIKRVVKVEKSFGEWGNLSK